MDFSTASLDIQSEVVATKLSGGMTVDKRLISKAFMGALIALVMCQPFVHSASLCACAESSFANKRATVPDSKPCRSACCSKKSSKSHCAKDTARSRSFAKSESGRRPLSPCECPRECPCQIQHQVAPASLAKAESNLQHLADELLVSIACNAPSLSRPFVVARGSEFCTRSNAKVAATCAELCRFLS